MSARKTNKASKLVDTFDNEDSTSPSSSNVEQNPFSFKQFINNPAKELTPEPPPPLPTRSKPTSVKLTDALADTLADNAIKKTNEKNPFSFKHFISSPAPVPVPQSTSLTNYLACDVSFSPPTPSATFLPSPPDFTPAQTSSTLVPENCQKLPDFINESLLIKKTDDVLPIHQHISSYFDLETNLNDDRTSDQTSEDMIKLLKKALKEKQQTIDEQSDRISQLEKKIIKLKQNEANENKALEDMIQQVEENLVKTTKRAVESERNADKMKQDLKQLKTQVSILQNENLMLKNNSDWDSQSKSLSDYAGQLSGAACNAEAQLKQLLKGCESLRLVAGSLESYGRIHEMKEPNKKNTK